LPKAFSSKLRPSPYN